MKVEFTEKNVICITLPHAKERRGQLEAHFKEVGFPIPRYFNGIYGSESGLSTSHKYEIDHPNSNYHIGPVTIGLTLSHLMAWRLMQFQPPEQDYWLLLEDDARFSWEGKKRLDKAMENVPDDWDMLYVGSCNARGKAGKEVVPNSGLRVCKYAHCTHAIAYRRKVLDDLIREHAKVWAPIDLALCLYSVPQHKTYGVFPRVFEQHATSITE